MNELVTAAAVFAAEAHSGQKRKELNEPYIIHPLRVGKMAAQLGQSPEFIAACYLHDVVEDTNVPMATIEVLFPPETVALVKAMTKWWESDAHTATVVAANKDTYYAQIMVTPGCPLLKVLDRIDNLYDFAKVARMSPSTHKWAKKYHQKTVTEIVPVLNRLVAVQWLGWNQAEKIFNTALSALEAAL